MSATNLNQEQDKITFQLLKKKHDEGFARFKQVQKRHLIRKEIGKLLKIYQNPDIIPKIGEFLVVSKNSDFNPQKVIGANVMGLLDKIHTSSEALSSKMQQVALESSGMHSNFKSPKPKTRYTATSAKKDRTDMDYDFEDIAEGGSFSDNEELTNMVNSQYKCTLSQNIKTIVKKQNIPCLTSANKLLLQGKSMRPMTASIKEESVKVNKNFDDDLYSARKVEKKSKHTYKIATERSKLPLTKIPELNNKHTEEQIRNQEISPFMITHPVEASEPVQKVKKRSSSPYKYTKIMFDVEEMKRLIDEIPINEHFLPLEPYDPLIGKEIPEEIMKDYSRDGVVTGYAEYMFPNGDKEERLCEVQSFSRSEGKYNVKWVNTDTFRKVSRLQLRFEQEDEEELKSRIEIANESRRIAELIVRMIEEIKTVDTTGVVYPAQYALRIKQLISGYHINQYPNLRNVKEFNKLDPEIKYEIKPYYIVMPAIAEGKLIYTEQSMKPIFSEIYDDYRFSIQKSHIEYCLPYSKKLFEFRDIIPEHMYIPLCEKNRFSTNSKGLIQIERNNDFNALLEKMSNKLHQARPETLEPLMKLNLKTVKYSSKYFVMLESIRYYHKQPSYLNYFRREKQK